MNRAVALLAEAKATGRGRAAVKPIRIVGNHPADNAPIELYDGRYGMYVKHDGINATVPRDLKPEELTVDQAVSLLAERAAKGGGKKPARKAKKAAPVAANDAGENAAQGRQGQEEGAPKKKAKARRNAAAHRNQWLRAESRPATNCWHSSRRAPRPSASARSRAPGASRATSASN